MKRYFMKDTEDELVFGDVIELDFVGEEDGKTKHCHLECVFSPDTIDELIEEGIIEVREDKEEEEKVEIKYTFSNFDVEAFLEAHEDLEKRVEDLDNRIIELEGLLADKKTA